MKLIAFFIVGEAAFVAQASSVSNVLTIIDKIHDDITVTNGQIISLTNGESLN